jgi:hypothetical protein
MNPEEALLDSILTQALHLKTRASMRRQYLESIADTIHDFREGEISRPDAEHVDRWVRQFDGSVQEPILGEMDHLLQRCYLSRNHFLGFLRGLAERKRLVEPSVWHRVRAALTRLFVFDPKESKPPGAHWKTVHLLDIQKHGASQRDMLKQFRHILFEDFNLSMVEPADGVYLYLDDIVFTGNRVIADLARWLQEQAPPRAEVIIGVLAGFRRGLEYSHYAILRAARHARKHIRLHWITGLKLAGTTVLARRPQDPRSLPRPPGNHAAARLSCLARLRFWRDAGHLSQLS